MDQQLRDEFNKDIIVLSRSDLQEPYAELPIEKITIHKFKISIDDVNSAQFIVFVDDDKRYVTFKRKDQRFLMRQLENNRK